MPTLSNLNGASLVPDISQGLRSVEQAFGTPRSRERERQVLALGQAELDRVEAAPAQQAEIAGLVQAAPSASPAEQEKILARLAAIDPTLSNSLRSTLEFGDERQIEAERQAAEQGLRQALLIEQEKDPAKRREIILNEARQAAGRGDDAAMQSALDMLKMTPDQLEVDLQRKIVAGNDIATLMKAREPKFAPTEERKIGDEIVTVRKNPDGSEEVIARAPRFNENAGTTVNVSTGTAEEAFSKEFGKANAKQFFERRESALDARASLQANVEAFDLLDSGVITGFGAEFKLGLGKALQAAGFEVNSDPIAATEAYGASRAQEVGRIIKLFGAGTGLSDADRAFAEKAAGGKIDMTEAAIRRILEINERASRNVIENFNKDASQIDPGLSPFPLTVDPPELAERTTSQVPEEKRERIQAAIEKAIPGAKVIDIQ